MANGDTPSRKAHVKRIFQLIDANGNVAAPDDKSATTNTDIWIDVMRFEKVNFNYQTENDGHRGQQLTYYLNWNDDANHRNPTGDIDDSGADAQYENANADRKMNQLEIKDPDSPTDSTQSVLLWVTHGMAQNRGGQSLENNQALFMFFDNVPATGDDSGKRPNTVREVTVIKVFQNDLNGLVMDDGNGNSLIVDWDSYKTYLLAGVPNQDKTSTRFLSVEIADKYWINFAGDPITGIQKQQVLYKHKNTELEDGTYFDIGDQYATFSGGGNAAIRTDPFQIIVNTSGGLAVIFGPADKDAPDQHKHSNGSSMRLRRTMVTA